MNCGRFAAMFYAFFGLFAVQDIIYTVPAPYSLLEKGVHHYTRLLATVPVLGVFMVHWGEVALSLFCLGTLFLYLHYRSKTVRPWAPALAMASVSLLLFETGLAILSPETMDEHVTNFVVWLPNIIVLAISIPLTFVSVSIYLLSERTGAWLAPHHRHQHDHKRK